MKYSVVGDSPVSVDSGLANAAPMSPAKPVIVASARKANRSRASVEEDRGRVVRVVIWVVVIWVLLDGVGGRTPLMLLSDYCQIDAPHCQTLPMRCGQICATGTRPRRSAAISRAAAFCQLCSERCGTSVTSHCQAWRAVGSRPAAVAFCAYARTPATYGKYREL